MREQVTFGRSAGLHVLGPVRIDVPTDSVVLVSEPALCLRALRAYRRDAGVNDSVVTPKRIVLVRAGDGMFVVKAPDYATNILVYYDATFRKILATRDAD